MADACPVPDLDPFSRAFLEDPYPGHERPREAGPAVRLERYGAYGLARHAEVQATLADWRTFCSSAGVGLSDFRKEPPWRLRGHLALSAPASTPASGRTMARMEGCGRCWARWPAGSRRWSRPASPSAGSTTRCVASRACRSRSGRGGAEAVTEPRVVIVGTGQGGLQAAASLREAGFAGPVTLVGDEPDLPYQRPPLSKAYLLGKMAEEGLRLRSEAFLREERDRPPGRRAGRGDRPGDAAGAADSGPEIGFDHLVLATGARNRPLPVPGADLDGVLYLRTLAEARA